MFAGAVKILINFLEITTFNLPVNVYCIDFSENLPAISSRTINEKAISSRATNETTGEMSEIDDESEEEEEHELEIELKVLVFYEGSLFPGKITELISDTHVKVSCMKMVAGVCSKSLWKWPDPEKADINTYPIPDVRKRNIVMNLQPGTSRNTVFHVPDLDSIWGI